MLAFARFLMIGLVLCTAVFAVLWVSLRVRRRRLLLESWKTDGQGQQLHDWLDDEHARYDRIRLRSLIALVYVLPLGAVTAIIYLTNFH